MITLAHTIQVKRPTIKQQIYFAKACGTARFAYNWGLALWKKQYESGIKPSAFSIKKEFNAIKHQEYPWVSNVTKCAPEQAFANLGTAFNRFFKGIGRYPKFKKKGISDSFYLSNDQFYIKNNKIKIPKLGFVNLTEELRFEGKLLSATVTHKANKWFVSVAVELEQPPAQISKNQADSVGIDLGLDTFALLSDGSAYKNPRPFRMLGKRLALLQRKFSKTESRSHRRLKLRLKIARLYLKISNIRSDFLHKLSSKIVKNYRVICLEDLNVKGMVKNRKLAKHIYDVSFYEFKRQLTYKSQRYGNWIQEIDRFFPSSKLCSNCGNKKDSLSLSTRLYICEYCGNTMNRDLNAAVNIEKEGLRLIN